jgi:peroxiredoxin
VSQIGEPVPFPVGRPFPDLALTDTEGRVWHASDLSGGRAILFCFASW